MKFTIKLTLALAVASILNYLLYLSLKETSDLTVEQLGFLRLFTGIPLGVFFTNWIIKRRRR